MRKSLRIILLLIGLLPATAWGATVTWDEGGFTFEADDTGSEASVVTTSLSGAVTIPSAAMHDGKTYTVTIIKAWFIRPFRAPVNYKTVTSITIPATVRWIATGAFGLSEALTEMKVEAGSNYFVAEDGVLYNKEKTTIMYWPVKKNIGNYVIPSTIKSLSGEAFSKNKTLTAVTIPASITSIGAGATTYGNSVGAFDDCENLASVTFGTGFSMSYIPSFCFDGCKALPILEWPSTIKRIDMYAFKNCEKLNVPMPLYLEQLGRCAFEGCDAMPEVIFPSTMKSIDDNAFNSCANLKKVVVPENCDVTVIPEWCFSYNYKLTDVTLSSKITTINSYAFLGCRTLVTMDLPANLKTIGGMAFCEDVLLENLTFHDKVETIGYGAFAQCRKLKEIDLPQTVKTIGIGAFLGVAAETFTIPAGVTSIGGAAFACTPNMESITVEAGNTKYVTVEDILFTKDMKTLLAYPAASVRDVSYTVPASVTIIQEGAFSYARLTHITLPSALTTIYNGAFAFNYNLTELTIPSAVTSIGKSNASNSRYTLRNENIISKTGVKSLYVLNATTPPVLDPSVSESNNTYVVPNTDGGSFGTIQYPVVYMKKTAYDSNVYQSAPKWSTMTGGFAYEVPVTLPASGLKTMGRDFDVDLSASDLKAYVATSATQTGDSRQANMTAIAVTGHDEGKYVPSRMGQQTINGISYETYVGVILKGDKGASLTYRIGENDAAVTSQTNYLVAATDATKVRKTETKDGVAYTNLGLNSGMFRYFTADGIIAYNKCWLSMPESMVGTQATGAGAKAFVMNFIDGEATGINEAAVELADDAPYYNLQGVRVSHPRQGVYIHKGKKVIIK